MTRLIACPTCELPIAVDEQQCPHCNAAFVSGGGLPRVVPVLLGLALAGCPGGKDDTASNTFDSQAAYGVPDTDFTASITDSTTEGSSSSGSTSSSGSESSGSSESTDSSSSESSSSSDGGSGSGSEGASTGADSSSTSG